MNTIISIRNVGKKFGAFTALQNISLDIRGGEFFALLGPSGCGKSTLLRIVAGLDFPTSGELLLDGKDMTALPPNKRPVNMVFQSYAVFPHMTAAQNVAYGLKIQRLPAAQIKKQVDDALAQVHLLEFKNRMPDKLSGGQRQRVALARALVKKPRVLLLDEPLSALDAKLRGAMRGELVKLQNDIGVTFIMVTHDQSEAMAMATRVAVLDDGRLQQVDAPKTLYNRPKNVFVADFIGRVNLFAVEKITRQNDKLQTTINHLGEIAMPAQILANNGDGDLSLAVRPENIRLQKMQNKTPPPDDAQMCFGGIISQIAYQGECSLVEVALNNGGVVNVLVSSEKESFAENEKVWCLWEKTNALIIPK